MSGFIHANACQSEELWVNKGGRAFLIDMVHRGASAFSSVEY